MSVVALAVALALAAAGCVDAFGGSNLQMELEEGVPRAGTGGIPADTFLSFYAVRFVVERDADGGVVRDPDGNPVVLDSFTFHVQDFELRPLIQRGSPCFIEVDNTPFPGLHVTQFAARLRQDTGIIDPLAPPPDADPGAITDILDADRRIGLLSVLESTLDAVTSLSQAVYPAVDDRCIPAGGDPGRIPPSQCVDDASNAVRLAVCEAFWADNPDHYEGNDKVFTVPLNGRFFGMRNGINPLNGGTISGSGFFVDEVLSDIDALLINWQYKDLDGDGSPDFPPELSGPERSSIGFHFMTGVPIVKTRGVLNVPMANDVFGDIRGEAAIFPDLDEDRVNF